MRLTLILVGMLVMVVVALWLVTPDVVIQSAGPAEILVARPEAPVLLLLDGGEWRVVDARNPLAEPVALLPETIEGIPALAADGRVLAVQRDAIVVLHGGRPVASIPHPDVSDAGHVRLVGLDGRDQPVLQVATSRGQRMYVRDALGARWLELLLPEGEAATPPPLTRFVLAPRRQAIAFRGVEGWEAWAWDEGVVRAVARDCRRGNAIFTPDGNALIVDGKTKGLFQLSLDDGRLSWMADGNLGLSERVPFSAGFRGDPVQLVTAERDLDGYMQILQINLGGGGRWGFSTGFEHHYAPVVSPDGTWLVFAQAPFDEQADDEFREDLYLFNFARPETADALGSRWAGRLACGPVFLAGGEGLIFIANDDTKVLDLRDN